ncbi:hypothetical protein SteCoe_22472 [Stentor coeruleus]|uniref:Uncharacterized protein n=1 Tax=Stentor coeruleus TaxID=5963 RepID=A0A1R2BLY5_9CILI|nr:hypothetical protein SteCoe_22472 [Stentor coeruleus]
MLGNEDLKIKVASETVNIKSYESAVENSPMVKLDSSVFKYFARTPEMFSTPRNRKRVSNLQNCKRFILFASKILKTAIKRQMILAVDSLRQLKNEKPNHPTLEIVCDNSKFISISLILESCLKNFCHILNSLSIQEKFKTFQLIKKFATTAHSRSVICKLLARKFTKTKSAFTKYKCNIIEMKMKKIILTYARKRAGYTRLYHFFLKRQIHGFNYLKSYRKAIKILNINKEFSLFQLDLFLNEKIKEVLKYGIGKIRFLIKIKNIAGSSKIKSKFASCIKKLNALTLRSKQSAFNMWQMVAVAFKLHSMVYQDYNDIKIVL